MVSITYGHGFMHDCDSKTGWTEGRNNMTDPQTVLNLKNNDYLELSGTCDGSDDEYFYEEYDLTDFSSATYSNFLIRWKTSVGSNGLGASVKLVFDDASTETILGTAEPQFSTSWTVTSGTISAEKTVDTIRLQADDYPTSVDSGTYEVSYDYVLIYEGTFTLPNTAHGYQFHLPPRYALLQPPSKVTDTIQNLGGRSATVRIGCDLDQGDWKPRTNDYVDAEVLYDIAHNSSDEPWQWLDDGKRQFKVALEEPAIHYISNGDTTERRLELLLREYSLGDKSQETVVERFGLDL